MKNEDQLTDALLKEHAKHGTGADEKFLKELEERLDAKEAGDKDDKIVAMPKKSAGTRWALGTGIAACLALGFGGVYFWGGNQQKDIVAYHEVPQVKAESVGANTVTGSKSSTSDTTVRESLYLAEGYTNLGKFDDAEAQYQEVLGKDSSNKAAQRGLQRLNKLKSDYQSAAYDHTRSELLMQVDEAWEMEIPPRPGSQVAQPKMKAGQIGSLEQVADVDSLNIAAPSVAVAQIEIKGQMNSFEDSVGAVAPASLSAKVLKKEGRMRRDVSGPFIAPGGCVIPVPEPPAHQNNERYGQLVENKFKAPIDERSALSTFAVDVDTASYANLRRMINHGQHVPADSVRIEEMVNYFDYDYAQPSDKHPFAVHVDSAACPWNEKHRLVRVGIQGKDIIREERPATNLVFLLDVSGSMNSFNKLPLLKKSMKYLLEELNDQDTVSIVVYAGASGLALPATKVDDAGRQKIEQTMDRLSAGGSTAGGQGIKLAYKVAKENFKKDGVNRIILATDGDFNVGVSDNASLTKLVKEKAKQGTYLSVLGFGHGNINDAMLESITNNGNGNYSYIDSVKEGRKVLLEDMMGTMVTIAKDVKVQVVMNPNKVKAYRLIGYANRMLPPEAFLDKKVDAGEIGAGHTVTALYEVIPADGTPFGDKIDATRYFKKPETKPNPALKDSPEMMFVKLAYKQPDQKMEDESTYVSKPFVEDAEAKVSNDHKFASAVGLFGMVVRNSEHKGNGNLEMVLKLAKESKGTDGKAQRAEFIQLVEKFAQRESR